METLTHLFALFNKNSAATLVLLFMLFFALFVAYRAQGREDFDFADMLRDEQGKPSALRLGTFLCIGVSSWLLIYIALNNLYQSVFDVLFGTYLFVISGAKVAEKGISMLEARYRSSNSQSTEDSMSSRNRTAHHRYSETDDGPDEDPEAESRRTVASRLPTPPRRGQ